MKPIVYRGHRLTEREADIVEQNLLYKFAYDRGVDLHDYYFMTDRGYLPESLIRRTTLPGMPVEVRWPYKAAA